MKYTEVIKAIENYDKKYNARIVEDSFIISYDDDDTSKHWDGLLVCVDTQRLYDLTVSVKFKNYPHSADIWNYVSLLAATPIEERQEINKYNVIFSPVTEEEDAFIVWGHQSTSSGLPFHLEEVCGEDLVLSDFTFTDDEYEDLIKYIKTLTNGKLLAELAERSKFKAPIYEG